MVEKSSTEILDAAAKAQDDRAKSRDTPEGERSMRRCVEAFNALEGTNLTEAQGWRFMAVLKLARATAGSFNLDDYVDGASYFSLAGEAAQPRRIGLDLAASPEDEISEHRWRYRDAPERREK